jgi:chromosomal replication initiator protein
MRASLTITTFGCAEYLQHRGLAQLGTLRFERSEPLTIRALQHETAAYFGVPVIEMTSERRSRWATRPRQVAMYLSRHLTRASLPEIGRRFGWRDHTTVIHAIGQIERLMAEDAEFEEELAELLKRITGRYNPHRGIRRRAVLS